MIQPPCHLGGLGVLVTRPAHQADALCELIEQAHGRPIRFPTLEILPAADPAAARAALRGPCDLLVFVSANAVEHAYPLLPDDLPADLPIAAVGAATAQRLVECGLEPTLVPAHRFDSEGLLALPALQDLHGRTVVIVRGNEGRTTLGETLSARGATVVYAEVYRRSRPQRDPRNLLQGWDRMVDVVTVSSVAGLDNLFRMLGDPGTALLQRTPLVVVSPRLADRARAHGCHKVHVAASALDQAVLDSLCRLAEHSG
jgi:uroporphyrinogen-III synthase